MSKFNQQIFFEAILEELIQRVNSYLKNLKKKLENLKKVGLKKFSGMIKNMFQKYQSDEIAKIIHFSNFLLFELDVQI